MAYSKAAAVELNNLDAGEVFLSVAVCVRARIWLCVCVK